MLPRAPRRTSRSALLTLALSASAASAVERLDELTLEELLTLPVETSSRRAQAFATAPARSLVVTAQQIRTRRYVNLKDLLQDLPGVNVYENFNDLSRSQVAVRGVPGTQTFIILQDGRRLSSVTGEPLSVEDNYPLAHVKQVEVMFGPASALYGADAASGVINLITEVPESQLGATAGASVGTDGYRYATLGAHARLGEKLVVRMSGHLHGADNADLSRAYPDDFAMVPQRNPFTGETVRAERGDRFDASTASHSLLVEARYDRAFTVGLDRRFFSFSTAAGIRPEYVVYGRQAPVVWQSVYAEHRGELAEELTAHTLVSYNTLRYLPEYGFTNFFTDYQPVWKSMSSDAVTVQENLSWALSDVHHLGAGAAWSSIRSEPQGSDLRAPVDPSRPAAEQGFTLPGSDLPVPFYTLQYGTLGGYLQLQSQWLPQLSTTVGLRYDADGRFQGTLNPRMGAVYQPSSGHTLKLLYGEAFLAPSTYSQYAYYGAFTGRDEATGLHRSPYFHLPNPGLRPMKARTLEVDYLGLLAGRVMVGASGYLGRTDGIITPVVTAEREPFAGGLVDVVERYQSIGRATQYGGTASVQLQESVGPVGVDAWASYTLSLGRSDDGTGTAVGPLPYNTPHTVKGGLTVSWANLQLTPRFRWGSDTTGASDPTRPGERALVPGATVVDASLHARDVVGRLSLTLDVRNALDTRHYAPGNLGVTSFVRSPQETRRVMLQATYAL